ncbi:MAG TPA: Gfo/Idh/MocA family oxidoreductase [Stellaceae bacterium]|nr:Gfo/Idh/MocA family oxidoreductase [Stellaceae bacterium]
MGRDVKVALIGSGYWGKNLARVLKDAGALAVICDIDTEAAKPIAAQASVPLVGSLSEVLTDDGIAAVVVATPAVTHFPIVQQALEAGKDVLVEKPLALEPADAETLAGLAGARRRILMVGHLLQYHAAFLHLKEMASAGELGRLSYLYSTRLNLGKLRREENVLWSFAPHDISMILSLAGEMPERVTALGHCYLHEKIADITVTHLDFASGLRAHVFVSWLHPVKEQKLVAVGDRGMLVFDDTLGWGEKLMLYPHGISWRDGVPVASRATGVPVPVEEAEPLRAEVAHFLDCVRSRAQPRTDAAEGIRVLSVRSAAQRAIASGAPVTLSDETRGVADGRGYFVHPSAVVDAGAEVGAGTKIWHFSHVLGDTRIGRNCVLGQNVMAGPSVVIGDGCKIQNNVSIYKGVRLEDEVFCGPSMVFTNVLTPRAHVERKDEFAPTLVKKGATLGANATVICGHTIGRYAMVGAGAVVTRDVPDHALVVGNPARVIGWVSAAGERLGPDLVCPRTGERYRKAASGLVVATPRRVSAPARRGAR